MKTVLLLSDINSFSVSHKTQKEMLFLISFFKYTQREVVCYFALFSFLIWLVSKKDVVFVIFVFKFLFMISVLNVFNWLFVVIFLKKRFKVFKDFLLVFFVNSLYFVITQNTQRKLHKTFLFKLSMLINELCNLPTI